MEHFDHPSPRSSRSRPLIAVVALLTAGLVFVFAIAIGLTLQGCANEHNRPLGDGDITFGISPAGDALVFSAVGEGGRDLFLLDLKTLRVVRLAATPDYEIDPEFSPDGKSIVYAAGKPGDRADHIFLRSVDGKSVKQLTALDANDASPSFSPDGSLIVFTRDKKYNWGGLASNWGAGVLFVMKADGTGSRRLTPDDSTAIDPHFSPDGRTILFQGDLGLSTIAADGSEPPKPLAVVGGSGGSYAPDGRSMVFSDGRYAPDQRIFVARTDGTKRRMLKAPKAGKLPGGGCFRPSFTPDGKRIVFFLESWPDGATGSPSTGLWEIDLKSETPREIAGYDLFDDPLHWKPPAKKP